MKYEYEIIKIEDAPSLTEETVGMNTSEAVYHTKEHLFDLDNEEQKDKLIDIIKKYGLTKDEFSLEEAQEHPFLYRMLSNNLRKFNVGKVYYYYNKYLQIFDKDNKAEKYANGIFLYNNDELNTVNNMYRFSEKADENDETKGIYKENIDEFKNFFLSKRRSHDFKKDFDDIINAEDNAVEYITKSKGSFFNKKTRKVEQGTIVHTAKSPRMDFVLDKTHLTNESKTKFKKFPDLLDFLTNYNKNEFDYIELKEFFKAVDNIKNNYQLDEKLLRLIGKEERALN